MYLSVHYMYLTAVVTFQIKILHKKTHDELVKYYVLLKIKSVIPNFGLFIETKRHKSIQYFRKKSKDSIQSPEIERKFVQQNFVFSFFFPH